MTKANYGHELNNLFFQLVKNTPLQGDWQFDPTEQAELDSIKAEIAEQAKGARVLPPYLGEMGHEVQFFLGVIEPWLRSGWKIIARRPEFYPEGSVISNPTLFQKIDKLASNFHCQPISFRLLQGKTISKLVHIIQKINHIHFRAPFVKSNKTNISELNQMQQWLRLYLNSVLPYPTLRKKFWDDYLTEISLGDLFADLLRSGTLYSLPPTYRPHDYVKGHTVIHDHVGLQMRKYTIKTRNSNYNMMLQFAKETANFS